MYDKKTALARFCQLIKYKTVSGLEDEFVEFRGALKDMYPNVYKACEYKIVDGTGLMFRWKGKASDESVVLMSHYDVVPAQDGQWEYPPFSGAVIGGRIWGRGTLDTKCTFCAIMESAEALIAEGFVPSTDIYLCFGGNEETSGSNAEQIAAELKRRNVRPFLVLDEGGAVADGSMAGIRRPCALVGIAEKGYMDVEFITSGKGGHSSLGGESNPITVMAEVITRVGGDVFKPRVSEPVKIMIDAAARHADLKRRIILRNYKLLGRFLYGRLSRLLPEISALTKTTGAITQISGGNAENVIPERIRAVGNFRIISGSGVEETLNIIRDALRGLDVEVKLLCGLEPSDISETEGKGWDVLSGAISKTWSGSVIIPYLMLARSDSRSYCEISRDIYRFSPIALTKAERGKIHGVDENITEDGFCKIIDFYISLITGI